MLARTAVRSGASVLSILSTANTGVAATPVSSAKAIRVERRVFMGLAPFKSLVVKIWGHEGRGRPARSGRIRPDRSHLGCSGGWAALGRHGRERVVVAVLDELAGAREREVRTADHHLVGNHL